MPPKYYLTLFDHQSLYLGARFGKGSFRIKVLTLVLNITENRLRHASGPVHYYIKSVTWIPQVKKFYRIGPLLRSYD